MKNLESEHQKALIQWVRLAEKKHPELKALFAIPNGGKRDTRTAANLKREGVKAGVWDLCLPIPKNSFVGLWVEMKYGKNKLTENQKEFQSLLEPYGHKFVVCYSWEEARDSLLSYLDN